VVFYNCSLSPYLIDFTYRGRAEWYELNLRSQGTMQMAEACGFHLVSLRLLITYSPMLVV